MVGVLLLTYKLLVGIISWTTFGLVLINLILPISRVNAAHSYVLLHPLLSLAFRILLAPLETSIVLFEIADKGACVSYDVNIAVI